MDWNKQSFSDGTLVPHLSEFLRKVSLQKATDEDLMKGQQFCAFQVLNHVGQNNASDAYLGVHNVFESEIERRHTQY